MHELGHCFDLAHTPKGIMGRGFDDMNAVWTMWRRPPSEQNDLQLPGEKGSIYTSRLVFRSVGVEV